MRGDWFYPRQVPPYRFPLLAVFVVEAFFGEQALLEFFGAIPFLELVVQIYISEYLVDKIAVTLELEVTVFFVFPRFSQYKVLFDEIKTRLK